MIGFINAVATLIILGQLDDFTGFASSGPNRVVRTVDLFRNLESVHLATLTIGVVTIVLILTLEKTSLKSLGLVVALLLASLLVPLLGAENVTLVRDIAEIPNSLPRPMLPSLSAFPGLVIPALALTFVGLMQGASISRSIPNPDGNYPNPSGDFVGQGVANLVSGLFQGTAVGGSMSATALVMGAGARSRLANIFAGVVMAVAIVVFGRFVGLIAMPSLAALVDRHRIPHAQAGPGGHRMADGHGETGRDGSHIRRCHVHPVAVCRSIWGWAGRPALCLPTVNRVRVVAWEIGPGQYPVEAVPPTVVPAGQVTILYPYGSLFYAAASVFQQQLPGVADTSRHTVVILLLRGKPDIGSTFWEVVSRYADALRQHGSELILAGVTRTSTARSRALGCCMRLPRMCT